LNPPSGRHSVFISYSHRDREWLDRVTVHLRPLIRDSQLVVWDDTQIVPGSRWEQQIEAALATAKIAVLLVSADFLASDFIAHTEVPTLLEAASTDGAVILPLVISSSRFLRTPLAQFQSVNDPARPLLSLSKAEQEDVLLRLTEAVERALVPQDDAFTVVQDDDYSASVPLLDELALDSCLVQLGCRPDLVELEARFVGEWLRGRVTETRWSVEQTDVEGYLEDLGEPATVSAAVRAFAVHVVACCAPQHGQLDSIYLSVKKVGDAYRLLQVRLGTGTPGATTLNAHEKLSLIHAYLLKSGLLTFLPSRLLLGGIYQLAATRSATSLALLRLAWMKRRLRAPQEPLRC
jgi:hypothetical protein